MKKTTNKPYNKRTDAIALPPTTCRKTHWYAFMIKTSNEREVRAHEKRKHC